MCAYLSNKKEGNYKCFYLFTRGDNKPQRPGLVCLINGKKRKQRKKNEVN